MARFIKQAFLGDDGQSSQLRQKDACFERHLYYYCYSGNPDSDSLRGELIRAHAHILIILALFLYYSCTTNNHFIFTR